MTANRFTVDSDGKYWDRLSNKYVTIDHLFYLVEKLEKENEQLRTKNNAYIQDIEVFKEENTHLKLENDELKQVLGSILIEVRRDISATNHSGEVKAFVNPNSFDLISDVLKKYGALKDWYE